MRVGVPPSTYATRLCTSLCFNGHPAIQLKYMYSTLLLALLFGCVVYASATLFYLYISGPRPKILGCCTLWTKLLLDGSELQCVGRACTTLGREPLEIGKADQTSPAAI